MATTWKLESASKITKHTQKTGLKKNNKINHVLTDKRLQHLEWKKKKKVNVIWKVMETRMCM